MKHILLILILSTLSTGCAAMCEALQDTGKGLQQASNAPDEDRTLHCTPHGFNGQLTSVTCH